MTRVYQKSVFIWCLFLGLSHLSAQDFNIDDGGTISTCNGFFFDAGGPAARHGDNNGNPQVLTICPDGTTGGSVRAFFSSFDIAGTFEAFNGPNTSSPLLLTLTSVASETAFEVRATAANTSGCLTFRFESTAGGNSPGWQAAINCVTNCQPIEASIVSSTPATTEVNGAEYIDACPGEIITLTGTAIYPENNAQYAQSNATSTFTWTFQDGTSATGQTVEHEYAEGGGYEIELTVTDQRNCRNSPRVIQRARIAPQPQFGLTSALPPEICPGEDFNLTIGGTGSGSIGAEATERVITFTPSQTFSELTILPDGNGVTYSTPLEFLVFQPDQTLQSGDQIVNVCATMEHSFLGDLAIWLECPDGSRVDLHIRDEDDPEIGRQVLGGGLRNTTTPDPCGVYCWTVDAARTMREVVVQDNIERREMVPEGDFRPEGGSFDALIGCPLNGAWTLNILDGEEQDNGSICSWSIGFRADVFLGQPEFTFPIQEVIIRDNGNFTTYDPTDAVLNATNPGPKQVKVGTRDSLSCFFDTTLVVNVASPLDPDCYNCGGLNVFQPVDTSVCPGDMLTLDFSTLMSPDTLITWEAIAQDNFSSAVNPNRNNSYGSPIGVSSMNPATLVGGGGGTIESVCVSLVNNGDLSDITLELESPGGDRLLLLSGDGGSGEDLLQTCFSPSASAPFSSGSAPYTGTFVAENNNWNTFAGTATNGTWTLHAWDAAGGDVSRFVSWSITLRQDRELTFAWSPDATISCTDCPNPTFTPTVATEYELTVSTVENCEITVPVSIDFNALNLNATESITMVSCNGGADGSITVTVSGVASTVTYAWEDDPSITTTTRVGLTAGTYTLIATDEDGCMERLTFTVSEPAPFTATAATVSDAQCFGDLNGIVEATPMGGTAPFTAVWDDPAATDQLRAENLAAGTYNVVLTDANGCTATASATVSQPDELVASASATPVVCRGENNGTATVTEVGGTEPFSYLWSNGATSATITDLAEGSYTVTVTDANDCTSISSADVNEPDDPLTVSAVQTVQGCADASANAATAMASGGAGGYSYSWDNGETTMTAVALPAGVATVTITDIGGCARETTVLIEELDAITVTITGDAPSCNDRDDGTLTATPSGGSGATSADYTYTWSNGETTATINNLPGGISYSVTVMDIDGCEGEATFNLPIPPPIVVTSSGQRTSCFDTPDGSITLTSINGPNGGPYGIQWGAEAGNSTEMTVSDLAVGTYSLLITDLAGCTLDTTLVVSQPDSLEAAATQVNVSCNGDADGSISANPIGGTAPYSFSWSTGSMASRITDLAVGTYTLSLTDANGCLTVTPFTITEPDVLVALPATDSVRCAGQFNGAITVNSVGGTGPFLYSIAGRGVNRTNLFEGLEAGSYAVTVTDANGCSAEAVAMVADGEFFSVDAGPDTSVVFGDSITLFPIITGGKGLFSYTVTPSTPTSLSCLDCPNPTLRPQFPTDVTYRVTDGNGCVAEDRVNIAVPRIRNVAVPGGFSPDGNNINDRLLVHGRPGTRVVAFQVFDRWTNILYEGGDFFVNDPNQGWDGTNEGNPVNAGVYLYKLVVQYDDLTQETLSGQTTLIR